jgi:hypothetical protein
MLAILIARFRRRDAGSCAPALFPFTAGASVLFAIAVSSGR